MVNVGQYQNESYGDEYLPFKGALLSAEAGLKDLLNNVDWEIMVKETMKKQPDYNIEKIC